MSAIRLENHIANRFLTDDKLVMEILESTYPEVPLEDYDKNPKIITLYDAIRRDNQKSYYCTNSVLSLLDLLKISKKDGQYDWSVFNSLPDGKFTFIFPDNKLLRLEVKEGYINMIHVRMDMYSKDQGHMKWVMFYVKKGTGEKCEHFAHEDVQEIEEFIYKLLCFVYLTENDEIILQPKQKHGTKKGGKVINIFPIPLTIINSRWNSTTIRTESFSVRGHFAIRWTGQGRTQAKIVFIQPFEKSGYVRKAKSTDTNNSL